MPRARPLQLAAPSFGVSPSGLWKHPPWWVQTEAGISDPLVSALCCCYGRLRLRGSQPGGSGHHPVTSGTKGYGSHGALGSSHLWTFPACIRPWPRDSRR